MVRSKSFAIAAVSSFGAGEIFPEPIRLAIYDDTIADTATPVVRAKAEAKHRAKRADKGLFDAAKRETRQLIISKVEDTWIRELKDETTPKAFLEELATCMSMHEWRAALGAWPQADADRYNRKPAAAAACILCAVGEPVVPPAPSK